MPPSSKDRPNPESTGASARLDGWKDIAAYLGKADRTVKRWEADRGLPVRRVPGRGRGTVYAYPAELNAWLESSHVDEEEDAEPGTPEDLSGESATAKAASGLSATLTDLPAARESSLDEPDRPDRSRRRVYGLRKGWVWALAGLLLASLALVALRNPGVALAARVRSLFAGGRHAQGGASPPAVPDAERALSHNLYLEGRYEWNQRTPESLNRALNAFTAAVAHDPSNAQAYAGLADTYDLMREYTTMPDREAYSRAIAAARKAVELDDSLEEGHRALAYSEMYGSWDFAGAEKEFKRAIELNPKDPEARRWYANAFASPGRYAECLEQIEKAQELDPTSHVTLSDKGWMLYNAGRTAEAIALLKEVESSVPQFRSPHVYLMMIDLDLRDYPEFLAEGQKAADSMNDPAQKDIVAAARAGYARDGGRGLMHDLYAKQKQYYAAGRFAATVLAKTCVLMGKKQEALDLLEQAYVHHETEVLASLAQPDLLSLKDEPRYKALVRQIDFPPPAPGGR